MIACSLVSAMSMEMRYGPLLNLTTNATAPGACERSSGSREFDVDRALETALGRS